MIKFIRYYKRIFLFYYSLSSILYYIFLYYIIVCYILLADSLTITCNLIQNKSKFYINYQDTLFYIKFYYNFMLQSALWLMKIQKGFILNIITNIRILLKKYSLIWVSIIYHIMNLLFMSTIYFFIAVYYFR